MTWVVVVLGLAALVFLHELAHFCVARWVGMKPRALYIGFPPPIAKVERNGVEYGIGAVPLGGYTRIPGMLRPAAEDFAAELSPAVAEAPELVPEANTVERRLESGDLDAARSELPALATAVGRATLSTAARRSAEQAVRDVDEGTAPEAYWRQPVWKRVAAIAAGPAMNALIAFLLFFVVYATGAPSQTPGTEVAQVDAGSPAAAAGLRVGDRIVAVNGQPTRTFTRVSTLIRGSRGRPITVTVDRGGRTLTLGPRRTIERQGRWIWGFVPATRLVSHPAGASARLAAGDCWRVVTGTVTAIADLLRSHSSAGISGPVGVARASQQFLQIGVQWYLQLLGLISMSLALFNALPFLPLDGGHVFFSLLEGVRGRAVPQTVYRRLSSFGMVAMLLLTVISFSHDLGATPR